MYGGYIYILGAQQAGSSASWSKRREQHEQDKRHRGPSTARFKRCVMRQIYEALAQDDGFVGASKTSRCEF
jgi:hypothetical protein